MPGQAPSWPDLVWRLFLLWTAIGFVVMPLGVGEGEVRHWLHEGWLRRGVLAILHVSDALWIAFAAVVVYLHTAADEGLPTARRWAATVLLASTAAEAVGASTGFPFGPYHYTENFGWLIGGIVPVAIPLAWLVILLCARVLILSLRPGANRWELALGVGLTALVTDLNLEFVAWKVRGYWVWYPDRPAPVPAWPPWQNFAAWFGLSFALSLLLTSNHELRLRRPPPWRPLAVLGLMNALFAVVHATHWLRVSGR